MLLVIYLVLGLGIGVNLVVSHREMQQALRWWVRQEVVNRATYADRIQNGLIQDLFALRLSLQSASTDSSESLPQRSWLAASEKLHTALHDLSTAFLSPYLPDSPTLAIRTLFQQWQAYHPIQHLQLDLPADWSSEPLEQSYLILALLQRLLELTASSVPIALIKVHLVQQNKQAQLSINLIYVETPTQMMATHAKDLKYLRRCFRCLVPGWCRHQVQELEATWQFGWKKRSQLTNKLNSGGSIDETS